MLARLRHAGDIQLCMFIRFKLGSVGSLGPRLRGWQAPEAGRQQAAAMRAVVQRVRSASVEVSD